MQPHGILETCLYVDDLAASEEFYRRVLGLEFDSRVAGRHVFLRLDQQMFLLFRAEASSVPAGDIPPHGAVGPGHVAFSIRDDEFPAWQSQLESHGIAIERIHTWPGGGRSLYFRDPAGNSVELTTPKIWGLREASF